MAVTRWRLRSLIRRGAAAASSPCARTQRRPRPSSLARDWPCGRRRPRFSTGAASTQLLPPGAVHQGLALEAETLAEPDLDTVLAAIPEAGAPHILVMLDQVTDPHNVGAILRSAAAFAALAVIVPEHGAPRITGVLAKAASGALEAVPLVRVINLARCLERVKAAGFLVHRPRWRGAGQYRGARAERAHRAGFGRRGHGAAAAGARALRFPCASADARHDRGAQCLECRGRGALCTDAAKAAGSGRKMKFADFAHVGDKTVDAITRHRRSAGHVSKRSAQCYGTHQGLRATPSRQAMEG